MANKKNSNKQQQQQKTNEDKDYSAFKTALFHCLLVLFLPLVTFWVSKTFLFEDYLHIEQVRSNIYSAISAIVALHLALGLYIYRAYFEKAATETKKQD